MPHEHTPADQRRLWAVKLTLLVIVAALVGKLLLLGDDNTQTYPLVTWDMFVSGRWSVAERTVRLDVIAVDGDGEHHVITASDLYTYEFVDLASQVLWQALGDRNLRQDIRPEIRQHVAAQVGRLLRDRDIVALEGQYYDWSVDLSDVPPVDLDQPDNQRSFDGFAVFP